MNRMDKITPQAKEDQIFTPVTFIDPSLYYNPLLHQNLLITEQTPPNSQNNNKFNRVESQISKNPKKNQFVEISLISLLNAISDLKSKNSNLNSNSKNTISNNSVKNESFSSESGTSDKKENSYAVMELLTQKTKRSQKYCNACPHHNAPHYAKGMCSNCYHSRGRKKKPWNCPHSNKFHYALGLCQNCYQMRYMKKQNDDGIKIIQSSSNLDIEEISNNSFPEKKRKNNSSSKKGKSAPNRQNKRK